VDMLVRDRDAVSGRVVRRRLRGLGIQDRPTAPRSPWQNAYVERLIGSIQRECVDHVIGLGESHLRRIVSLYASYYNEARTHLSLAKDAPIRRPIEPFGCVAAEPMVGGLHHRYARAWFSVGTASTASYLTLVHARLLPKPSRTGPGASPTIESGLARLSGTASVTRNFTATSKD
jgi:Integrase core domain